jgi:hypothetical protein
MKTNILYGGYDIELTEFIKHLKKFNSLAKQICKLYPGKKIYIPIPMNKDSIQVAIKQNSIQYHPDKLKKMTDIANFFSYVHSDNDSIYNFYSQQNKIMNINDKLPFIFLLYEQIIDIEEVKDFLQTDNKGNYIPLKKLIDIINEYFAIPIAKDKINFILLNDEDIDITAENKAPSAQTPKTQHNLLAIKHHTAHIK